MLNKYYLIGRLTKDPELRPTSNGTPRCSFVVATDKYTGNRDERAADFISCVAWNKQAENLVKYCRKGSLILIEGALHSNSYENSDGKRVYRQDVTANRITFLNTNRNSNQESQNEQNHRNNQNGYNNNSIQNAAQDMNVVNLNTDFDNAYNIMDDDIQF